MILIDSSAWIEFLRDTGSPACQRIDALLSGEIATCDPVAMEILAGARSESHHRNLRRLLARATTYHAEPGDYEMAAALYRTCRQNGETIRRLVDCLIAAIAIRNDLPVLHADSDFAALERHTELRVDDP